MSVGVCRRIRGFGRVIWIDPAAVADFLASGEPGDDGGRLIMEDGLIIRLSSAQEDARKQIDGGGFERRDRLIDARGESCMHA